MQRRGDSPRRPRDAVATRAAILNAARGRFARDSYERVGVRDIAVDAGITAALVIRYFGSKERLFGEVITQDLAVDLAGPLAGHRAGLGERLARHFLYRWETRTTTDPLLAILRAVPNAQAAALLRSILAAQFIDRLADRLAGDGTHAALRADLVAAQLLGLAVYRNLLQMEPLASCETERLVAIVAPALQHYLEGDIPDGDVARAAQDDGGAEEGSHEGTG